jgi:hypothetical protein
MKPRPIHTQSAKVLEKLTEGVEYAATCQVDNSNGVYMPVHVSRVGEDLFSIAHYSVQNGELVADPRIDLWRRIDGWYPVMWEQKGDSAKVLYVEKGQIVDCRVRAYFELRTFCMTWLVEIRREQGL